MLQVILLQVLPNFLQTCMRVMSITELCGVIIHLLQSKPKRSSPDLNVAWLRCIKHIAKSSCFFPRGNGTHIVTSRHVESFLRKHVRYFDVQISSSVQHNKYTDNIRSFMDDIMLQQPIHYKDLLTRRGRDQTPSIILLPRDTYAQCGLCCHKMSVCLSVRLSHAGIMSKRLNTFSNIFHHLQTQHFYQTLWQYSDGDPQTEMWNAGGV